MCDAWFGDGRVVDAHPVEAENGLICITGLGVAFEPLHALQLALELERVAGAAYARERQLYGAQPRLPLFERAAEAPEVPRD